MAILVTGGLGYIGSRLVARLSDMGERIQVLDLPTLSPGDCQPANVRVFAGSILDRSDVERAMSGCDKVYHLAAYARNWNPDVKTYFNVNVRGTEVVLEAALRSGVNKMVHTSSNVALGASNGSEVHESTVRISPFFTPYEHSKYLSEQLVREYVSRGLNVVIVNPSRVFGPGPLNESNSVTKMISWYMKGKWRLIPGSGAMVGNYVYVDDLIQGYLRAMENGRPGERYVLGGENVSFNEFFEILSNLSNRKHLMLHLPGRIALGFSKIEELRSRYLHHYPLITPGWAKTFLTNWANSCEKATRELGYSVTPFRDAMKQTVEWLRENSNRHATTA